MLEIEKINKEISMKLSIIKNYIEMENASGCLDINRYCEDIFCHILNATYNIRLVNLNRIKYNHPAVDLGDKASGICIQVTASGEKTKVKKTLETYLNKGIYKDFPIIKIFILGEKKKISGLPSYNEFIFDESSILDFTDLRKEIEQLDLDRQKNVHSEFQKYASPIQTFKKANAFDAIKEEQCIYPTSYCRYKAYVGDLTNESIDEAVKGMREFINDISQLDDVTRVVIYAIYKKQIKGINYVREDIIFNSHEIYPHIGIERRKLDERLKTLQDHKMFRPAGDLYEEYDCLSYKPDGYNVFCDFFAFLETTNTDVKEVLEKLDFSVFD